MRLRRFSESLDRLNGLELVDVAIEVCHGQSVSIAAQRPRQGPALGEPPSDVGGSHTGKQILDKTGYAHDVPLKSFGRVNGEQLHAIAADVDTGAHLGHRRLGFVRAVEAALFDGGSVEVVEERCDADVVAACRELRGDIDQAIEIGPRRG